MCKVSCHTNHTADQVKDALQADFNLTLDGINVAQFTTQVQTIFKTSFANAMNIDVSRVIITTINGITHNMR